MKKTTLLLLLFVISLLTWSGTFAYANTITTDSANWARNTGIIQGYPDGNLHLERSITRAEMVMIIDKLFEPEILRDARFALISNELPYEDISSGFWAEKQLLNLTQYGFIQGYPDHTFRPNKNVTFAEVSKMMLNVLDIPYEVLENERNWYDPVLRKLNELGITLQKPYKEMTREDVVNLLYLIENATGTVSEKLTDNNKIHQVYLKLYMDEELLESLVVFLNDEVFHDDIQSNYDLLKNRTLLQLTLSEYWVDQEKGLIYVRISQDLNLYIKEEILNDER